MGLGSAAVGADSFHSMADSFLKILSWAGVTLVLLVVLSSWMAFFRVSHAFLVCSGQLLACRKASTVAIALWVWIEFVEVFSGDKGSILAKMGIMCS